MTLHLHSLLIHTVGAPTPLRRRKLYVDAERLEERRVKLLGWKLELELSGTSYFLRSIIPHNNEKRAAG